MRYNLAIICILILSACGPAARLRRAERLIKMAERQGATWTADTVYKEIAVIVPETKIDTVVRELNFTDTLVITRNNVVTKIKVDTVNKSVYVSTKCPEKLVTVKTPVVVNRTIKATNWLKWWHIVIALIVGYFMGRFASWR